MPRERKIGYERRETTATISKYSCIGMWPLFESDSNEDLHFSPTKDTALLDDATPRYNDTLSQSAKNEEDAIQIEDANPLEDATPLKLLPITGQSQENHERERSYLTHFVSPGEFYVQDEQEQLIHKSVLFKLTHLYNSKDTEIKSIENVEYGQLYACKQEGRQLWERCKILKPGSDSQNQFAVQLIDVGAVLTLSKEELCYIDTDLLEIPPLAKHCQLWGLRPAGHISQWSKSSIDHASEMFKSAKAYIKVYHTETSQDYESTIHYVRLFFEKVQLGGALECDQYITTCLNDDLFEKGLALRHSMTVSTHPSNRWPCKREIPGEFAAVPISFEDDGFVYLHASGAHNQREAIAELLEWHYAKMNSEEEESNLWKKNAPCIIKNPNDERHYRATVIDLNEDSKEAVVFLIDYAERVTVPYVNMRKKLVCFEYAPQAWRCRLAKYAESTVPVAPESLENLKRELLQKSCCVSVVTRDEVPTVYIKLQDGVGKGDNILWSESKNILPVTPSPTPSPPEPRLDLDTPSPEPTVVPASLLQSSSKNVKTKRASLPLDSTTNGEPRLTRKSKVKDKRNKQISAKKSEAREGLDSFEPSQWYSIVPSRKIASPFLEENVEEEKGIEKTPTPKSTPSLVNTPPMGDPCEKNELLEDGTFSSSSSDPDTGLGDYNSSGELDDITPPFSFEDTRKPQHSKVVGLIKVPLKKLIPIRIQSLESGQLRFQPDRHRLGDCPSEWSDLVQQYSRLWCELQRSAPLFPNFDDIRRGLPCACLDPIDDKWYRGIVFGVNNDHKVKVYMLDNGSGVVYVSVSSIKQLPAQYLNVPRNSLTCRLVCDKKHLTRPCLDFIHKLVNEEAAFYGFFENNKTPNFRVTLYYEDMHGNLVPALDVC